MDVKSRVVLLAMIALFMQFTSVAFYVIDCKVHAVRPGLGHDSRAEQGSEDVLVYGRRASETGLFSPAFGLLARDVPCPACA